jgi:hypothetical protein
MKVGDLVKVTKGGLRVPIDSIALVTRIQEQEDSSGTTVCYWAYMVKSGYSYFFRLEHLEVISESW